MEVMDLLLRHGGAVNAHAAVRRVPSPYGPIKFGGQTPLHDAARSPCAECVARLLARGAKPSAADTQGATPFLWAVRAGRREAAALLLAAGVDPDQRISGETPLHAAAYRGDSAMVALLLRHGAKVDAAGRNGATALHRAVGYPEGSDATAPMSPERLAVVRLLLESGASGRARGFLGDTPLHLAASQGYAEAVALLVEHGADVGARNDSRSTPLHDAAMQGRGDVVSLLLAKGADPDARSESNTPLSLAVRFGHNAIVAELLARGGDVHVVDHRDMSLLDEVIYSPLPWSPERAALLEMLIAAGIDLRRGTDGPGTALHRAVERGQEEVAALLLRRGADVDARDRHGRTPLHLAVERKELAMVELLIAGGADVNARDRGGRTPLYSAWGSGVSARIAEILRRHGGRGGFGEPAG